MNEDVNSIPKLEQNCNSKLQTRKKLLQKISKNFASVLQKLKLTSPPSSLLRTECGVW